VSSPQSNAPENRVVPPATLTYPDAAAYLGISVSTLKRLVHAGSIRHIPVSGRGTTARKVLFRRRDLDDYLDGTARGGDPKRGRS